MFPPIFTHPLTFTATPLVFVCEALTPLQLDGHRAGSNLRGALGEVMRRAYCGHSTLTPVPSPWKGEGDSAHSSTCPVCWLLAADERPGQGTAVRVVWSRERFEAAQARSAGSAREAGSRQWRQFPPSCSKREGRWRRRHPGLRVGLRCAGDAGAPAVLLCRAQSAAARGLGASSIGRPMRASGRNLAWPKLR
jgi:hypothetical protein